MVGPTRGDKDRRGLLRPWADPAIRGESDVILIRWVAACHAWVATSRNRWLSMADNLTPQSRRRAMAAVKSVGTTPELAVRAALLQLRYRIREHDATLPGKPDFVLARKRIAILVHGCYWHGHRCARGARIAKTNVSYWQRKISGNVARDKRTTTALRRAGWRVLILWECQLRRGDLASWISRRIAQFR
jgi:DNA mismatch endonuclease, patch repair protein